MSNRTIKGDILCAEIDIEIFFYRSLVDNLWVGIRWVMFYAGLDAKYYIGWWSRVCRTYKIIVQNFPDRWCSNFYDSYYNC